MFKSGKNIDISVIFFQSDQHSTVSAPTSAEVHGKGPAYDGGQQNPNKNEAKEVTQPPPQKPARYPAIDYEGTTTTFPAFPEPPSHSPAICGSCGGTGTTPASSSSPQQQQQPKPAGGNDLEFDALAKRFEELKKKI